jgi:hypothetical protein
MTQWHPLFAQLLRPAVEAYYEVQTTVAVGDAPREADFVLLRRTAQGPSPFRGLWRHLTAWNILEFKGPTVSPRSGDVELLVELGLGIDRRLHAGRAAERTRRLPAAEISFWYLANRLGQRFLHEVERKLGALQALGPGLWRCQLLGRLLFWVSGIDLPVEPDSLPLHLVGQEPLATERRVAQLVLEHRELQERYGGWLASLHPTAWREVEAMAQAIGKKVKLDLRPAINYLGLDKVIDQVGLDRVIAEVGLDRVIAEVGLDRVIAEVGPKRVIEQLGVKDVVKQIGMDRLLASLSPAERRELKRRLQ